MLIARRVMIAGGAAAFALLALMLQTGLVMLGVLRSVAAVGLDIPNTAFVLAYGLCAFVFLWGIVGPLPRAGYMLSRR